MLDQEEMVPLWCLVDSQSDSVLYSSDSKDLVEKEQQKNKYGQTFTHIAFGLASEEENEFIEVHNIPNAKLLEIKVKFSSNPDEIFDRLAIVLPALLDEEEMDGASFLIGGRLINDNDLFFTYEDGDEIIFEQSDFSVIDSTVVAQNQSSPSKPKI